MCKWKNQCILHPHMAMFQGENDGSVLQSRFKGTTLLVQPIFQGMDTPSVLGVGSKQLWPNEMSGV
jgi:hypothetical protein